MYTRIGPVSETVISSLRVLLAEAEWDRAREGEYDIWHPDQTQLGNALGKDLDPRYSSFFLRIPAGGRVHRHVDAEKDYITYHIPVYTNPDCTCFVEDVPHHLTVGSVYEVDRTRLHWSQNQGDTDRVHLLLAEAKDAGSAV